jgi:3-oxoacyl-[acyl-carrier protein] reductase
MQVDFSGRHVIVTGGTRGIGAAIATAFLDAGADVTATYLGNEAAAEAFRAAHPGRPLAVVRCDVADYAAVEAFYTEYDRAHPALDVLVNNAGIRRDGVVGMMPPEDWQAVLATHLTGTFQMSKFGLLKMLQRKYGRIVTVTSPSGRIGFAGQANYAAAKAGQVGFTKSLAREAARRGITVNCVCPGFIDTELLADLPPELKQEYRKQVPLQRFGTPAEVASAVLFLASPEAGYITGSVLDVTGGI